MFFFLKWYHLELICACPLSGVSSRDEPSRVHFSVLCTVSMCFAITNILPHNGDQHCYCAPHHNAHMSNVLSRRSTVYIL